MATTVLGVVGGVVGAFFGMPQVGAMVGAAIGSVVDNTLLAPTTTKEGQRLTNLQVQSSDYGAVLPTTFGTVRNTGTIIWAEPIEEMRVEQDGGEKKGPKTKSISYEYYAYFAVAIADNEIAKVNRVWADGKILWDASASTSATVAADPADAVSALFAIDSGRTLTAAGRADSIAFYLGTEDQGQDPTMVRFRGADNVPAYRGVAYIVFNRLNLKDFGYRIPTISVEYSTLAEDPHVRALAPLDATSTHGSLASSAPHAIAGVGMGSFASGASGWCAVGLTAGGRLRATVATLDRKKRTVAVAAEVDGPVPPANATTLLSAASPSGRYVASVSRVEAAQADGGLMFAAVFDTTTRMWLPPCTVPASMISLYGTSLFWLSEVAFVTDSASVEGAAKVWHPFYLTGTGGVAYGVPASRHLFATNQVQAAGPILQDAVFVKSENDAGWVLSSTDYHGLFYYGLRFDTHAHALHVQQGPCTNLVASATPLLRTGSHVSPLSPVGEWLVAVSTRDKDSQPYAFTVATRDNPSELAEEDSPNSLVLTRGVWIPPSPSGFGFGTVVGMVGMGSRASGASSDRVLVLSFGADGQRVAYYSVVDGGFRLDEDAVTLPGYQMVQGTGSPRTYYATAATSDALLLWHEGNLGGQLVPILAPAAGLALADVVAALLERAGYDEAEFDVSRVADDLVGYSVLSVQPTRQSLETLQSYSPFDVVTSGPTLRCQSRSGEVVAAIPDTLAGAFEGEGERAQRLQRARVPDLDLPRSVTVNFIDSSRDYQTGSAFTPRVGGYSENDQVLNLPVVMSSARAKGLAQQTLYRLHGEHEKVTGSFPLDFAWLEPADVVVYDGLVVRLSKLKLGSGVIEFDGSRVFALTVGAEDAADDGQATTSEYRLPALSRVVLLDVPAPRDSDDGVGAFGLHFAVSVDATDDATGWPGAGLVLSRDGVGSGASGAYRQVGGSRFLAETGTLAEATGAHSPAYWDRANGLRVRFPTGTSAAFTSGTDDEAHESERLLLVGGEYVSYATATPEADGTWTFRDLLRGRRGTESEVTAHPAGTRVVAVDAGVRWLPLPSSDRGRPLRARALTFGTTLGDNAGRDATATPTGATLRPYAPVHARGDRDDAGNLTVRWDRCTRAGGEWADGVDAPLNEAAESYLVDVLDGTGAVVRTLASSSPSATYVAADQVADFGAPQATVRLAVCQLSGTVGRGFAAYAVV